MHKDHIVLLETGSSHHECLYSQVLFLRDRYRIHLLCSEAIHAHVKAFDGVERFHFFPRVDKGISLKAVKAYLLQNQVKKVIINTATGKDICRLTLMLLFSGIEVIGVLHNTQKLTKSTTQKLINLKIHKYFVLSDYLLAQLPSLKRSKVTSFLPIFFPEIKSSALEKPEGDFWVTIPGGVELKRRNYLGMLEELALTAPKNNVRFIILGKAGDTCEDVRLFKSRLEAIGLRERFVFFDDYLDNGTFYAYLNHSDLILPLIDESTQGRRYNYTRHQASGTFGLAIGFAKPMLIEPFFAQFEDFQACSFFYQKGQLVGRINELAANRDLLAAKEREIGEYPKFKFDHQRQNYLNFIA